MRAQDLHHRRHHHRHRVNGAAELDTTAYDTGVKASDRQMDINKRIRDIRQLPDQAGRTIQPGLHHLTSLDDLYRLAGAEGIDIPPQIKTAC